MGRISRDMGQMARDLGLTSHHWDRTKVTACNSTNAVILVLFCSSPSQRLLYQGSKQMFYLWRPMESFRLGVYSFTNNARNFDFHAIEGGWPMLRS